MYYTSHGIPTKTVDWASSFSVSNTFFSAVHTLVQFHERVYGNGYEKGEALINGDLSINWMAILFKIISFGASL